MSTKFRNALSYAAAIFFPLALAVGWHTFPLVLQRLPGLIYLLLVALAARFLGFGPAITLMLVSSAALWFHVLPFVFFAEGREPQLNRVVLFVTASIVIGSISLQKSARQREAEERYRSLVDLSPDALGVADENLTIMFVNSALVKLLGAKDASELIGRKTLEFVHPDSREALEGQMAEMSRGHYAPWLEAKWVRIDGSPIDVEMTGGVVREKGRVLYQGFVRDITERKKIELSLRQLSGRVLRLQDEERRRIAQELHDTTGQNLIALKLNLVRATQSAAAPDESLKEALEESLTLADQSINEIRTLAYLLHPPMIGEVGLVPSLEWYARGFEERTTIRVELEAESDIGRLPEEVETAVFRIVQEALTNIQRHSKSDWAAIRLARHADSVQLIIKDKGRGMPVGLRGAPLAVVTAAGVGVAAMYERVRYLGGTLNIRSDDHGTGVEVVLPIRQN